VESVKTASDIYAPVSGEVVAVNPELVGHPELVNSAPYAGGWFFKIQLSQPTEIDSMLTPESYTKQIAP
jgi:glycine cleavage system H protein